MIVFLFKNIHRFLHTSKFLKQSVRFFWEDKNKQDTAATLKVCIEEKTDVSRHCNM